MSSGVCGALVITMLDWGETTLSYSLLCRNYPSSNGFFPRKPHIMLDTTKNCPALPPNIEQT